MVRGYVKCSLAGDYILQHGAAYLYDKEYVSCADAAALWLQQAVKECEVSPNGVRER